MLVFGDDVADGDSDCPVRPGRTPAANPGLMANNILHARARRKTPASRRRAPPMIRSRTSGARSRCRAAIRPSGMPTASRDEKRPESQLQGRRALFDDDRRDGLVVRDRAAEVAVQQCPQVVASTGPGSAGRSPAACLRAAIWSAAAGRRTRPIDRIADDPHQEEHQGDQDPDHRDTIRISLVTRYDAGCPDESAVPAITVLLPPTGRRSDGPDRRTARISSDWLWSARPVGDQYCDQLSCRSTRTGTGRLESSVSCPPR